MFQFKSILVHESFELNISMLSYSGCITCFLLRMPHNRQRVTFSKISFHRFSFFTNLKFYPLKRIYNLILEGMIVWFPCMVPFHGSLAWFPCMVPLHSSCGGNRGVNHDEKCVRD